MLRRLIILIIHGATTRRGRLHEAGGGTKNGNETYTCREGRWNGNETYNVVGTGGYVGIRGYIINAGYGYRGIYKCLYRGFINVRIGGFTI